MHMFDLLEQKHHVYNMQGMIELLGYVVMYVSITSALCMSMDAMLLRISDVAQLHLPACRDIRNLRNGKSTLVRLIIS